MEEQELLNNCNALAEWSEAETMIGCTRIQRVCRCNYLEARRTMQFGLDNGFFKRVTNKPWLVQLR